MFNKINTVFFPNRDIIVRDASRLSENRQRFEQVQPFTLYLPDDSEWILPYEPLVSVSCENVIINRNVSKANFRGTVKERWAEGDVKINIQGTFVHDDPNTYPSFEVQRLREIVTQRRNIRIANDLLQNLGVNYIVVESYDFPFTSGENVQNYVIEAVSDDSYNLFIEVK
ncbi:DUF6046 domain-containing protein [Dysgonomonas sp. ZJ279]|uniref:DUF6046 domain-containing protein n=1 Tax=Dysgonomonas sp. ZJ279 TaxID=2709796 RepID=UPI0013EE076B|nr:DUF6046 domain-containing protein [Dysgonomonas sp. ZJ279]